MGRRAVLFAPLLLVAAAASGAIQTVTIGEMYDGGTVNLAPGDTLEIHPGACPAECAWAQAFGDPAIVKAVGDAPAPGAPVFRFRALAIGSSSLGLACRKPSDPKAPPGGLFRVLVVVKETIFPRGLLLEEPDNASAIYMTQGEVVQVRLPANPSTGYAWAVASNAPSVLQPQGDPKFEPASKPMPGAAGTQTFVFRIVGGGPVFLELVYRRPSEKDTAPVRQWGVFLCAASVSATVP